MYRGFVKVWRKFLDSGLIRDATICQLFLWILLSASYKPRKEYFGGAFVPLGPGQLVTSGQDVCLKLNVTRQKYRYCLERLRMAGFLICETTNKYTIITVLNWGTYQHTEPAEQPTKQPAGQPANNQQATNGADLSSYHKENRKGSLKKKPSTAFAEDSEPYRLAAFMADELRSALPTLKAPNLQKWAQEFDVGLRNDERMRDARLVAQVIRWTVQDEFWKTIIHSPAKLRAKFDALTSRMAAASAKANAPQPGWKSPAQKRLEANQEAGRQAKILLFGPQANAQEANHDA